MSKNDTPGVYKPRQSLKVNNGNYTIKSEADVK